MERTLRVFRSFEESDKADREYYKSLSPQQRLDLLLELIQQRQGDEAAKGFERVCRIVKLHES
jgi:hypothetical protein